jgi:hypothetical protein
MEENIGHYLRIILITLIVYEISRGVLKRIVKWMFGKDDHSDFEYVVSVYSFDSMTFIAQYQKEEVDDVELGDNYVCIYFKDGSEMEYEGFKIIVNSYPKP